MVEAFESVGGRFDTVFIDFYGTICSGDREAVEGACQRIVDSLGLDMSPKKFAVTWGERFFATVENSNHDRFQTLHACELSSLMATFDDLGVDADPIPFVSDLEEYWRNPPIYSDALEFLRGLNLPVCCVSNADSEALLTAIEKHDLRFDAVVSSEEAKCYKPDPGIFKRALTQMGSDPENTVHIGDSLHSDIDGAIRSGIGHVWLCRENRIHDIGTASPDCTISTLSELPDLLDGRT